jgi:uncharacterized membrane protein
MQRREKCFKNLTFVLFTIFSFWIALQFLSPIALPQDSVEDLSGLVALSDNDDVIGQMNFPMNFIYSAGDRLCHQKLERSFVISGNQMPFCSRCTAIWLGVALGLGLIAFYKIQLSEKFLFVILIGIFPIGIDGIGQLLGLWESENVIRFITGLLAGGVCGISIGIIIDEIKDLKRKKVLSESD